MVIPILPVSLFNKNVSRHYCRFIFCGKCRGWHCAGEQNRIGTFFEVKPDQTNHVSLEHQILNAAQLSSAVSPILVSRSGSADFGYQAVLPISRTPGKASGFDADV